MSIGMEYGAPLTPDRAGGPPTDSGVLSQLVDAMPVGLVVQNRRGDVVWSNPAARRQLELPWDTSIPAAECACTAIREDGSTYPCSEFPAVVTLRTGVPPPPQLMGVSCASGSLRWLEVACRVVQLPDGPGVASALSDVTAIRTADEEVRSTLHTLQRALLPRRAPRLDELDVAVRYQAAGPTLMIGGDFYGALRVDDARHAFFIGDVCGRGVEAAALTTLARHTLHAAARHAGSPDEALRWLHEAIAAEGRSTFSTAIFGFVERRGRQARVSMTLGGHPQPALLRHDGQKRFVGTPGQLLGILDHWEGSVSEVVLDPGDQLVLYTDGLLDTPQPRLSDEALLHHSTLHPTAAQTADALMSVALPTGRCPRDDTAVMVLGMPAG